MSPCGRGHRDREAVDQLVPRIGPIFRPIFRSGLLFGGVERNRGAEVVKPAGLVLP